MVDIEGTERPLNTDIYVSACAVNQVLGYCYFHAQNEMEITILIPPIFSLNIPEYKIRHSQIQVRERPNLNQELQVFGSVLQKKGRGRRSLVAEASVTKLANTEAYFNQTLDFYLE